MAADEVDFTLERELPFSAAVVFDALIDPELIGGWLGDADVEPQLGGCYNIVWLTSSSFPPTNGTIAWLDEPTSITVATDNRGVIGFHLVERDGAAFQGRTILQLHVKVAIEPAFLPRAKADWQISLDQLDGLLRGRPVDWENWERDRATAWMRYLAAATPR